MKIIKGKKIAENILSEIKEKIESQKTRPCLAVVLVGDNKASQLYVKLKKEATKKVGMEFREILFSKKDSELNIIKKIEELNSDENVNGIIVQLPLPNKLSKEKIINTIDIKKDVDGFHQKNQNLFLENKKSVFPVFPKAIVRMIESEASDYKSKRKKIKAVIVCKSSIFGRIMKKALEKNDINADFIFCKDLQEKRKNDNYAHLILGRADIVISACGNLNLISSKIVKSNAIIIDGGIIKKAGKIFGDVDLKSFLKTNCKISAVPGGVGPVTVATLLENVYLATKPN